ncbi:unnamed protein product [Strongylus vulgaris]|uniref:Uncharacterized protein n=1 Tax=Strongylus vulgaris TaxID=40348 RepID=A0A3P7K026_STRVU|nr:unnamed protein product [Strongylus vulgaris]
MKNVVALITLMCIAFSFPQTEALSTTSTARPHADPADRPSMPPTGDGHGVSGTPPPGPPPPGVSGMPSGIAGPL